jgi:hypothetical protein
MFMLGSPRKESMSTIVSVDTRVELYTWREAQATPPRGF